MEAALRAHLLTNSTIATQVDARIYPIRAPQDATLPRIVYQRIANETLISHDGFGGHQTVQIQIKAIAATYSAAKTLSSLIEGMANTFRGTIASTLITDCQPQGQIDLPESLPTAADRGLNAVSQDWLVSWKDA